VSPARRSATNNKWRACFLRADQRQRQYTRGRATRYAGIVDPVAPHRDCIFMIHPQITSVTFKGREGQIVFPDRPTEYPCSYTKNKSSMIIAYTNQNGWRFVVQVARSDEGTWSASKNAQTISGHAMAPFRD
jgi:hypothetical protein